MTLRSFARQVLPLVDLWQFASIPWMPRFLAQWRSAPRHGPGPANGASASEKRHNRGRETPFDPHSFYPAAWLGRLIAKTRPSIHGDIGSRVTDIGALSAFVPVIFVDHRPPHVQLPGLAPVAADIAGLPFPDKSLVSLSSLNVIGHGVRGHAGDPTEPAAALKALGELQRVLGYRGSLYLSVPVGRERVVNSQRIFAPETILRALPHLRLRRFSYIGDDRMLHADAPLEEAAQQDYGCGLFEFERA